MQSASAGSDNPRVSIVVPNYNYARFLRRRMNSILNQTYQNFEIVYLDDCSTDDSKAVMQEFSMDPRIRIFENEKNSGSPFIQINKGVNLARGEFIWVAEADDYADSTLLGTLLHIFDEHPKVGVAYCDHIQVSSSGEFVPRERPEVNPDHWNANFISNGTDVCRQYLLYQNTIGNFSGIVFRRDAFMDAGGADVSMKLCGDWMLHIKILLKHDLAFVSVPLNYYRFHSDSVRSRVSIFAYCEERYRIFEHLRKNVTLSEIEMSIVLARIMKYWFKSLFRENWFRCTGEVVTTIRTAFRVDPRLLKRLLWYVCDVCSFHFLRIMWPGLRDRLCPKLKSQINAEEMLHQ